MRIILIAAVVVVVAVFSAFFGWREWQGKESCNSPHVQGSAEIMHEHPVVLLGDTLEMKVTLRFCKDTVSVHRETFEGTDVSPFDFKSRSRTEERTKDGFTEWETRYIVQPLSTVPGKNYRVTMNVTYEVSRLPQFYTITSNEVFIASLVPSDIKDIKDIDRGIKEKDSLDPRGVSAIGFGGLLIGIASASMVLLIVRNRRAQKAGGIVKEDFVSRMSAWWGSVNSRDMMQVLYFSIVSIAAQDVSEDLRKDIARAEKVTLQSFNPDCDVEKIRKELEPVIEKLAPLLMKEGRLQHGMD